MVCRWVWFLAIDVFGEELKVSQEEMVSDVLSDQTCLTKIGMSMSISVEIQSGFPALEQEARQFRMM